MNVERLTHLREILENVRDSEKLFDLGSFMERVNNPVTGMQSSGVVGNHDTHACGTSACALGYACLDPQFRAEGLRMEADVKINGKHEQVEIPDVESFNQLITNLGVGDYFWIEPVFEDNNNFKAASLFFDLDRNATDALFDPDCFNVHPITPDHVINRINLLLENDGIWAGDEHDPGARFYGEHDDDDNEDENEE